MDTSSRPRNRPAGARGERWTESDVTPAITGHLELRDTMQTGRDFLSRIRQLPAANETGWEDPGRVFPGLVTRLAVRFAPAEAPAPVPIRSPFVPSATAVGGAWYRKIMDPEEDPRMRLDLRSPEAASRCLSSG